MEAKNIVFMLPLAIALLITSCTKYEEGPFFSFITREERIANDWKVEKVLYGNENFTDNYDLYELKLSKNGDAELHATYVVFEVAYEFNTSGVWHLQNNDMNLHFDFDDNNADNTFLILKLKEKELWIIDMNTSIELHLVPI